MASPTKSIPISPRGPRMDTGDLGGSLGEPHLANSPTNPAKLSPTLTRSHDHNDLEHLERQRTMDADFAMQLSRARSASLVHSHSHRTIHLPTQEDMDASIPGGGTVPGLSVEEDDEAAYFASTLNGHSSGSTAEAVSPTDHRIAGLDPSLVASYGHDPSLLVSRGESKLRRSNSETMLKTLSETMEAPPPFHETANQAAANEVHRAGGGVYRSQFDFVPLEEFAREERERLGISSPSEWTRATKRTGAMNTDNEASTVVTKDPAVDSNDVVPHEPADQNAAQQKQQGSGRSRFQQRRPGGKLALFESTDASLPPFDLPPSAPPLHLPPTLPPTDAAGPSEYPLPPPVGEYEERKPYRFSFYSNGLKATIHARNLCELPADGQSFEELFLGKDGPTENDSTSTKTANGGMTAGKKEQARRISAKWKGDEDANSWWLDILCPTDEEMRVLSKCFGIHPLTAEDIQLEETREKIELFRNYYLVCFRSFDQDQYSPTYLEPINYYIVVFREGILSFHFRQSPHPQNVRRRIKQLKGYISVTSDWISYALIDDITDTFGPLIQGIEYEVDSIDELVLILKEAEQSDMLRRIGACRKKVMGLLRLMGNKADVVKGLAKRCNENWSMAPKSDIGLYLSDIQDHLITMTQSLNHYEKLLSRSHSNYLAQISIEMTEANNQINDVLSRLTALGTVLIPMNLVTGLWGMNVHVPGQDVTDTYSWFIGIICVLVAIGGIGGWGTYQLMRRSGRRGNKK